MKRLLVTGYGGFVAGSIVHHARGNWEIHAFSLTESECAMEGFSCRRFDLRDKTRFRETFETVKPDVVIHTAALADIDYCQIHPEEAEAVNVGVVAFLARLCRDANARLIFCSTDTVFDGLKGWYTEEDAPNPINIYAETKVRAEQAVLKTLDRALVVRLSLVVGLPVMGAGNSFLAKMVASLESGEPMPFPKNEIRTPIDVITLGRAFVELAGNDLCGILHLAGNTRLNRYEMACHIAQRLGFSTDLVIPADSNAMAGRAKRPSDASLDNTKARKSLTTPMRTLHDALELILTTEKERHHANP